MKNFEKLLQAELDKLPYEKHLDDGQYNDGQQAGFELGARWALNQPPLSSSLDYGFIEWIGKYHLKIIIRGGGIKIWTSATKCWKFDSTDEMYHYYLKNFC